MKRVILAVAIAATCVTPALAAGTERTIAGEAQVIDGDSLVVRGVRIRILDVDAPESGQFCFAKAETDRSGRLALRPAGCARAFRMRSATGRSAAI